MSMFEIIKAELTKLDNFPISAKQYDDLVSLVKNRRDKSVFLY